MSLVYYNFMYLAYGSDEKCPYVYYRSDRRKIENLNKEGENEDKHLNFHLHNTLCLPLRNNVNTSVNLRSATACC